jgi:hypothetical protein
MAADDSDPDFRITRVHLRNDYDPDLYMRRCLYERDNVSICLRRGMESAHRHLESHSEGRTCGITIPLFFTLRVLHGRSRR